MCFAVFLLIFPRKVIGIHVKLRPETKSAVLFVLVLVTFDIYKFYVWQSLESKPYFDKQISFWYQGVKWFQPIRERSWN